MSDPERISTRLMWINHIFRSMNQLSVTCADESTIKKLSRSRLSKWLRVAWNWWAVWSTTSADWEISIILIGKTKAPQTRKLRRFNHEPHQT